MPFVSRINVTFQSNISLLLSKKHSGSFNSFYMKNSLDINVLFKLLIMILLLVNL